jgi:hypothetical protein
MARRQNKRQVKYSIAIIGEGLTEWHYFNSLKSVKRYSYRITPSLPQHSDYQAIFKKAAQLVEEGYDKVYCVLDVDVFKKDAKHEQEYFAAKRQAMNDSRVEVFETMPCTEYWFLIHFKDFSTKIYVDYESMKGELREYLPGYEKSNEYFSAIQIYRHLIERGNIQKAVETAERLRVFKDSEEAGKHAPFTEIDIILANLNQQP